jgi:hypothetical protein
MPQEKKIFLYNSVILFEAMQCKNFNKFHVIKNKTMKKLRFKFSHCIIFNYVGIC